ncbi:serine/threonine-protein kinase [Microbacterium halotolerans]|uniref:serine/threonine-protein kinase n=1 Tax=Microbacterium halotolerans TaxID=246613 RepID=UPI000E6AB80C|nr:serine/threonine-protein kinase [Microbacterium halotolerans]
MTKRPPAAPPQLPGFEYIRLLGSGGFADVFLYEQQMPKRRVAVKVLLPDRLESAGQQFAGEANVMAMLSNHPAIVTILQAGMSADQRPYIVMEHCPRPNLQLRYRRAPFSVAETLRTAIPVIAAVETAHRMGVLHRDIKPANVLVTEYNRPALTDFGIASNAGSAEAAAGMSIPWSPPESFAVPPRNGPETDVYQLGATVYTLLAGRAPFEIPGQRNSSAELIDRAERMPVRRIDRPDVPPSLEAALARAMAKRPEDRFPTAVAFARALQKVQIELEHSVTPIDILDDAPTEELDDENDGLTRVRAVMSIEPDVDGTRPSAETAKVTGRVDEATVVRGAPGADPAGDARTADATPQHQGAGAGNGDSRGQQGAPAASIWTGGGDDLDDATIPSPSAGGSVPTFAVQAGAVAASAPGGATHAPGTRGFQSAPAAGSAKRRGRPVWPWVLGGAALVAGLVSAAVFVLPSLLDDEAPETGPTTQPQDPVTETPPAVADLRAEIDGDDATFSWSNPDPQDGDSYQWGIDEPGAPIEFHDTREASVTVSADPVPTCIEVYLVRADGVASPAATACAS